MPSTTVLLLEAVLPSSWQPCPSYLLPDALPDGGLGLGAAARGVAAQRLPRAEHEQARVELPEEEKNKKTAIGRKPLIPN